MPRFTRYALLVTAVCVTAITTQAAEIQLRPTAQPVGRMVRLSDVAVIYRTDRRQAAALGAIELFVAPRSGSSRTWHLRDVQNALARRGVKLTAHRFSGSSRVVVGTPRVRPAFTRVVTTGDRRSEQQIDEPMVVVASRALERGMLITRFDVREVPASSLDTRATRQKVMRSTRGVVGMEITRNVREGSVLLESAVRRPILVRRGKPVRVTVYSGGIQIRTDARAEQDGALGDLISCQSSLDRRKHYFVRVTGRDEVAIFARGASAQ
ncbi:MAG: flagellar basal body P-ring formation protein FlgA [Planctomycetes bacterium]|nr:flagellar basal body P-ring formation protein FlgA [Planctomycetota bacterium]